jgi:hypothetical protein
MDKINFVNNDAPYLSAENLNQMQDNIEEAINEKNYLVATSTGTINLNGNTDITLTATSVVGTKLTLEDGKVKIGAGVSKVRISGSIFMDITYIESAGYIWGRIAKNASNVAGSISPILPSMAFISAVIPSHIIEVEEGDLFQLNVDVTGSTGTTRDGVTNTWLDVEVIE